MKSSVVIPLYNLAQYVGQTIDSVLRQTSGDFEIIIVDDCSTDDGVSVALAYAAKDSRIKFIQRETNGGVSAAFNTGLKSAQGDYVCPLSADDLLEPWMLEKQSAYLDSHPSVAAVFGLPIAMNQDGVEIDCDTKFSKPSNRSRMEWYSRLLEGNCLMGQTMLFRRSLVETLGLWDEKLTAGNDIDWFVRVVKEHDIYVQHIPMARIRTREGQLSGDNAKNRRKFADEMDQVRAKHIPDKVDIGFPGKLIIATPMQGGCATKGYIESLLKATRCLQELGVQWDWWGFDATADAERQKNWLCARFLEDETTTDLLFIRADLEWNPLGLIRVLMNPEEVVGGTQLNEGGWSVVPTYKNGVLQGVMRGADALLKTESLTSDFMRIKKSALQKIRDCHPELLYGDENSGMAKDYKCTAFFESARCDGVMIGGDKIFCRRWSALGQLWLEPQIEFTVRTTKSQSRSLDQYFRDLQEQQMQLKAA